MKAGVYEICIVMRWNELSTRNVLPVNGGNRGEGAGKGGLAGVKREHLNSKRFYLTNKKIGWLEWRK